MTTTVANQPRRINLAHRGQCRQIEAKCPGRDSVLDNRTLPRLTQNRQCTHLSFVQAQHYRDALESRAIRKLNHKSETVRIRLRRLEEFMRWVVAFRERRSISLEKRKVRPAGLEPATLCLEVRFSEKSKFPTNLRKNELSSSSSYSTRIETAGGL